MKDAKTSPPKEKTSKAKSDEAPAAKPDKPEKSD